MAKKMKGMANRTEYPIIDDMPSPTDKSVASIFISTATLIGIEKSKNRGQPLMALCRNLVSRLVSIC